jgi:hypothetical protein
MRQQHLDKTSKHTPVVCDGIGQLLSKASTTSRIGCNHHVALVRPDLGVPPGTPGIGPRALGSTVDIENQWVLLGLVKVGRVDKPRMNLGTINKRIFV